jgi:hypothetical protein
MPRTVHGVPHRQPLFQRRPIVRAASANGRDFVTVEQEEYGLAVKVTLDRDSVRELVD